MSQKGCLADAWSAAEEGYAVSHHRRRLPYQTVSYLDGMGGQAWTRGGVCGRACSAALFREEGSGTSGS